MRICLWLLIALTVLLSCAAVEEEAKQQLLLESINDGQPELADNESHERMRRHFGPNGFGYPGYGYGFNPYGGYGGGYPYFGGGVGFGIGFRGHGHHHHHFG